MATVVLDSSNLEAVLADATGEPVEQKKEEPKKEEAKVEEGAKVEEHSDDEEGEDGLTERQKKELSATMLKAIGKKHRQMKEAEEFAAAQYSERRLAEERAQQLQAALDAVKGKQEPVKESVRPLRQDFATDDEYIDAVAGWKADQKLAEYVADQSKQAQERAHAEMEAQARQRIAVARDLVPDFVEVTESADVEVPPAISGYMLESEMFAELGYHLAKNPELVVSLAKLKPAMQLVQIGKIESTLKPFSKEKTQDGATPSKKTEATLASETTGITPSKARTAPVIKPLSTDGAAVEKDPLSMNIRETISDWQKRQGVNLALRKRH